jgi:ureidoacrylate peracid hydrolase
MHKSEVRKEIADRVLKRRSRYHLFDTLDPKKTVNVVIDMQNMFCEPGAPAEVAESRSVCGNINRLNEELRRLGGKVVWITSAATSDGTGSEWAMFVDNFVAADVRAKTVDYMKPGGHGQKLWRELETGERDMHITKNRYSCFTPGSSSLERVLRSYKIENVLITGTKTNICCESTARDAMQLDYKTVMVSDGCAALSDEEHRAALENVIQQFGDVMTTDEVIAVMRKKPN